MKRIYQIAIIVLISFGFAQLSHAQEGGSLRDRLEKRQEQKKDQGVKVPKLSVRAEMQNKEQTQDMANATWMREVYRYLDLTKGTNGALYYPVQPIGERMNLYTMIFKLMANDNLVAYDYLDGREVFTDEFKVNFKDVLERLNIPVEQQGNVFGYNEYDIPSNDVMGYYVKEAWYFDQTNARMDVKIIAICPILNLVDDFGIGAAKQPQFWIPYENIRPYAARMPIMVSDKNNVVKKTVDDFFRLRLFEGEIYKVANMENKVLSEIYKTPEELEEARNRIEAELKQFEKELWVTNESEYVKSDVEKGIKPAKATKQKKQKNQSSGGNSSYSARDRRR